MSTLRPLKPCRHPGCRALTRDASGYCPPHAEAARGRAAEREARQDKAMAGHGGPSAPRCSARSRSAAPVQPRATSCRPPTLTTS